MRWSLGPTGRDRGARYDPPWHDPARVGRWAHRDWPRDRSRLRCPRCAAGSLHRRARHPLPLDGHGPACLAAELGVIHDPSGRCGAALRGPAPRYPRASPAPSFACAAPERLVTRRNGFALLAALWLLVAFSLVGLSLSALARDRRLAAANLIERTQALAAAQAGVEHLRSRLAR